MPTPREPQHESVTESEVPLEPAAGPSAEETAASVEVSASAEVPVPAAQTAADVEPVVASEPVVTAEPAADADPVVARDAAPAVEPMVAPASVLAVEPVTTHGPPAPPEAVAEPSGPPAPPEAVATDTPPSGRRAAPRPYPPSAASPEAAAAMAAGLIDPPVVERIPALAVPAPAAAAAAVPVTAAFTPVAAPPTPTSAPAAPVAPTEPTVPDTLLPESPAKPGLGRHLLGVLLGLVLTPVGLLLTGIGTARLADAIDAGDATDALGLGLLIAGALVLGAVVLLGMWSPAVPITGGILWGVALGTAFLAVPDTLADWFESIAGDQVVPDAVDQLTASAVTGELLVTGILLVAAGFAAARSRRRGRRWAEGVAAAQTARAMAASLDRPS